MTTVQATATHVERTDDPAVLRWVCHRDDFSASPDGERIPPDGSGLARLVAEGRLVGVELRDGDLLLRAFDPADWSGLAAEAQQAVLVELGSDALWLLDGPTANLSVSRPVSDPGTVTSAPATYVCAGCHVRASCGVDSDGGGWRRARGER